MLDNRVGDLQKFQEGLTRRLTTGAVVSMLLGTGMLFFNTPLWSGIAFQFIGWGFIDLVIALLGKGLARKKKSNLNAVADGTSITKEAHNLGRILWINTILDLFYIIGGLILGLVHLSKNPLWLGTGIGIIFQGLFLFILDLFHAIKIKEFFSGDIS